MINNLVRGFFISLDTIIYGLLEIILQLIMDLANYELFNNKTIEDFSERIYLILGIVMFFKIMISLFQILVQPDKINDKEQGLGGILKRVVISMILLVSVRPIFDLARDIQKYLLPVIPKVILDDEIVDAGKLNDSVGKEMAYYSFLPFFYYYDGCDDGALEGSPGVEKYKTSPSISRVADAWAHVNDKCPGTSTDDSNKDNMKYNYRWLISTAVGVYLVYVLVTIAVNIAVRAIKFGLCEIIAPIPIASYIDPKLSKQTFDNWVSTTIKVYVDLFVRLAVVYFIAYIFNLLIDNLGGNLSHLFGQYDNSTTRGILVLLFIIVGLLQFAKDMPKFITKMLGIPEGFGDITGMFKGEGWKAIGNAAGGIAGMAAAPISSALSNYNYSKFKGENTGMRLKRAANGFFAAAGRSTAAAFNQKGFKGAYTDSKSITTANARRRATAAANNTADKAEYKRARDRYDEEIDRLPGLRSQITTLNSNISSVRQQSREYMSEYETAKNNAEQYIQQAVEKEKQIASLRARGNKVKADQFDADAKRLRDSARIQNEVANQRHQYYQNAVERERQLQTEISDLEKEVKRIDGLNAPIRPSSYGMGKLSAAVQDFAGTPRATSKTVHEAASLLNNGKSKIFNAAKQKVLEKPTLIDNTITFVDDNGVEHDSGTFADVYNAYMDMKEGREVTGKFAGIDRATLESIYGNAWKDAAAIYIDRALDSDDHHVQNQTLVQDVEQFNWKLANDVVVDQESKALIDTKINESKAKSKVQKAGYNGGTGNFFKSSDDIGAQLETIAVHMEKTEHSKNES